jgi:isoquinoline 1-oxidoreductase alpha subunit
MEVANKLVGERFDIVAESGAAMMYTLRVNGTSHQVEADGGTPLLWVLRDLLGLKGTKFGCGIGLCGVCTVHIDRQPARACSVPLAGIGDTEITTIEAIGENPLGKKVQEAWLELDVAQCGYCQPGQIMSATAMLASIPKPTDADIDSYMSGNLCRCATYIRIRAAIKHAASSQILEAVHK